MPFENNVQAPSLIEILKAVTDANFDDDRVVDALDRKVEDGAIIMGYVSKETGEVSIHLPDELESEIVKKRLDAIFGEGTVYG